VQDRLRSIFNFANKDASRPGRPAVVWAVAATLMVGLAVVGCGSSNSSTTTSTAALSKPAFLAKGNAICTQGNQKLQAAQQQVLGKGKPSTAQLTSFVQSQFAPIIQGQINALRALGAPSGDEAKVAAMLSSAQQGLNTVKSNPGVLAGGAADSFANFRKLAHPYGLTACASG
jgi:hypothetical protein